MKTLIVDSEIAGLRLDEALVKAGALASRNKAQALIKSGGAFVNNQVKKASYIVSLSEVITYQETTNNLPSAVAEEIPIDVIYEDDCLLVVNKPAGLICHPGNGHEKGTLVNGLMHRYAHLAAGSDPIRPGLVHRIDKDTSGLLVVAKTEGAYAYLKAQLSDHTMHREYYALVLGLIDEKRGMIDAPIGRDPKSPIRFAVNLHSGKESVTYFTVLHRYEEGCTLLSCRLKTGRTHQIRVHLDYIGHPVIGDQLYGKNNRSLYDGGQLLHAYRLTFKHPLDGREVSFEAPLPAHFQNVLAKLTPLSE